MAQKPETVTERTAIITRTLCLGGKPTMDEIMNMANIGENGAWKLMYRISRVIEIAYADGRWYLLVDPRDMPY
jgi:hypothetical protein